MKLIEALEILARPVVKDAPHFSVFLACGFTPLHLQTFLAAELRIRLPSHRVVIRTGLFDDLIGSIERLDPSGFDALAAVVEWSDFDARLGIRRLGGWRPSHLPDITRSAAEVAAALEQAMLRVSRVVPTVICMPTLPLPPLFWTPPERAASFELQLHQTVSSLATSLSEQPGTRVANAQLLGEVSSARQRFDVKSDVITGFPYTLPHASALAGMLAKLIENRQVKKGLITDLDDTLWAGILGDDGISGISWHIDRHTHIHGLYQQFAASLAGAGILIGVASKNDPALVQQAFDRSDLLISRSDIFPFEVHWSSKSESVRHILDTWNVGADSVVFIDDSPMEIAEVKATFPELECVIFPKDDYDGFWDLLKDLRRSFGRPALTEDDSLRLDSIRKTAQWRQSTQSTTSSFDDLLRAAAPSLTFRFAREHGDARAFELVNKTNQFNLNGARFSEREWLTFFGDPAAFLVGVSYQDKYGSLGTIAVLMGQTADRAIHVQTWVMSCRAFSRRVEHECLRYLFEELGADTIVFDYRPTLRNGPLQEFFAALLDDACVGEVRLSRELFSRKAPPLLHRIVKDVHV